MTHTELLATVPVGLNEDLKQDCIVALLEERPATEAEAHAINRKTLNRIRQRDKRHRRRSFELLDDPCTQEGSAVRESVRAALSTLTHDEYTLLVARCLEQATLTRNQRRAVAAAKEKLRLVVRPRV